MTVSLVSINLTQCGLTMRRNFEAQHILPWGENQWGSEPI